MCGIFAYLSKLGLTKQTLGIREMIAKEFIKIQHRGPDNSSLLTVNDNLLLGFHRLSIMDTSMAGNQPFVVEINNQKVILICNGEIYNYQELQQKYNLQTKSNSDCEIILQLYLHFVKSKSQISESLITISNSLDGVFSFIIYDERYNMMSVARDPIGVRSLYWGWSEEGICFASELKAIHDLCDKMDFFPPGSISTFEADFTNCPILGNCKRYYNYDYSIQKTKDLSVGSSLYSNNKQIEIFKSNIKSLLEKAVEKRLMADREIGCLLSGGLDSSLIAGILSEKLKKQNRILHTFSIGMKGATDLFYARKVADHIGSKHHELIVTKEVMLQKIKDVIYKIESWDTTTVRASTPMILLCEWIKMNTDVTVIFSGEGSDEASGSYLYFKEAPDKIEFHKETCRLIEDLQYFDVLRSDKSVSCAGLEVRVPFLDKDFLEYYMSIDPYFKKPGDCFKEEKHLLRKSFDNDLLPKNVLWRTKEAFSDGCSSTQDSWYSIIQNYISKTIMPKLYWGNSQIKQDDYNFFTRSKPQFDEALYYRIIFNEYYTKADSIIPYYWVPKWCGDVKEPSARILKVYDVSS